MRLLYPGWIWVISGRYISWYADVRACKSGKRAYLENIWGVVNTCEGITFSRAASKMKRREEKSWESTRFIPKEQNTKDQSRRLRSNREKVGEPWECGRQEGEHFKRTVVYNERCFWEAINGENCIVPSGFSWVQWEFSCLLIHFLRVAQLFQQCQKFECLRTVTRVIILNDCFHSWSQILLLSIGSGTNHWA